MLAWTAWSDTRLSVDAVAHNLLRLHSFTCSSYTVWPGAFDLYALTTLGKSSVPFQALETAASLLQIVMSQVHTIPIGRTKKMLNLTEITCWAHGLPSLVQYYLSYCDLFCLEECIWVWAECFCNSWHCKKCILLWNRYGWEDTLFTDKLPELRGLKMAAPTGNPCPFDCAILALFCQCYLGT